jgi:hypothetical protein
VHKPRLAILSRGFSDGRNSVYSIRRTAVLVAGLLLTLTVHGFTLDSRTSAAVTCNKYAAVNGSDGNAGTATSPYASAQKLADSLSAGEIGCLRTGTFVESDKLLRVANPGITLQSTPGERATIKARIYVPADADGVTVRNLNLDGSPSLVPGPSINADDTRWINNNVTNHHQGHSCFHIGDYMRGDEGVASRTLISNNRIHDCGLLPGNGDYPYGHGIYINNARDTRIVGNKIYDNTDRGIQLRPFSRGSTIERNIIDGNGSGIIFSGDFGATGSDTTVENNVVSFPKQSYTVHSFYPSGNPVGQRNYVRHNCLYNGNSSGVERSQVGFDASNNVVKNPLYVNRAAKDFRLRQGSPCKIILAG